MDSSGIYINKYTVELDYDSPYHPRTLTIIDGIDISNNTVIFKCEELELISNNDYYRDDCLYMTLIDNGIKPKTKNYYEYVRPYLNFKIDEFTYVNPETYLTGQIVEYCNDLQAIFNDYNNVYLGSCPYFTYGGKSYKIDGNNIPDDARKYLFKTMIGAIKRIAKSV